MIQSRKSALGEFFQSNYTRLVNYVRSMIDDSTGRSSEDIVQDVMLSILDKPDIVAPITNLSAYVFRAVKNRIIDHYRSPEQKTVSLDRENEDGFSLFDVLPDYSNQPENTYHTRSLRTLIFRLIKELPALQMQVIVETEFNEKTFRELSDLWSVPVGTLLARKHRGMKTLRRRLAEMQEVNNG